MRKARWPARVALAAIAAIGAVGGRADAEPKADPKIEKADQLFVEARALLDSNLLQACAKFEESLQYNPAAIGTLLNVALCDEKLDRIASAVARFSEARDRALEQGLREYVRVAEQHLATLEPDVPHLAIKLSETLPGTKIVVDNRVIPLDALGDIAVDPGEREIAVSAPGRLAYRTTLVIGKAERKDVVIPALAKSVTITSSRRRIGQIATIAGSLAIGTAVGLGLYGRQLRLEQFDLERCQNTDTGGRCNSDGQAEVDRARTYGSVGTVVGVLGATVAGVGLYLWLRSPSSSPADAGDQKLTLVPRLGADSLGIAALGRF